MDDLEWPEGFQELVDKGVVQVTYDEDDNPSFSLTLLGNSLLREIDERFN